MGVSLIVTQNVGLQSINLILSLKVGMGLRAHAYTHISFITYAMIHNQQF